ncbi:MAG: hypothetical protein JXB03_11475 [Spirochaetales bacterium]|nr:hypothetical protein [Spirochaetales bacterium]
MEISEALAREIFFIETWHFGALLFSLVFNTCIFRNAENTPLLRRYLATQGALILWIVSKIIKTVAPVEPLRWYAIVSQYIAVSFLGVLFLEFAHTFRFGRNLSRNIRIFLYALSALYLLSVVTNPLHHLIYSYYDFYRDKHGPLFFFFSLFTYLQILMAIVLLIRGMGKSWTGKTSGLLTAAAVIPLIINILYITRVLRPLFDITPIVMTASLFFFGVAALRFNFLSPLPVARSVLLDTLRDPVIISTLDKKVVRTHILDETAECTPEIRQNDRIYRLYACKTSGKQMIWQYADITFLVETSRQIAEQNARLSDSLTELARRNKGRLSLIEHQTIQRSRRALHDILGHSLTQIIYLLRKWERENKTSHTISTPVSDECRRLVQNGIEGLELDLSGKTHPDTILSISLQKLIDACADMDIEIDMDIQGSERQLHGKTSRMLYEACREALTNAIRHGGARHIWISALFSDKGVLLNICDDGKGCETYHAGNGLSLLTASFKENGGCVRVCSEVNQGFQLTLIMPYHDES